MCWPKWAWKTRTRSSITCVVKMAYRNICITADGGIVCTVALAYTDAILADLSACGYADRWCYHKAHNHMLAAVFLHLWLRQGTEEPEGWHRHPDTGRRVDEHGNRYINH